MFAIETGPAFTGNYRDCRIRIEPGEPGRGYELVNDAKGAVLQWYIQPIVLGIQVRWRRVLLRVSQ